MRDYPYEGFNTPFQQEFAASYSDLVGHFKGAVKGNKVKFWSHWLSIAKKNEKKICTNLQTYTEVPHHYQHIIPTTLVVIEKTKVAKEVPRPDLLLGALKKNF